MADKSFIRMESTCLEDELDFLNAVFFEELQILDENTDEKEKTLFLNLEPSTADDKTRQFVFVKIKVVIPHKYPLVSPKWSVMNSRGLSDELLTGLLVEAKQVSDSKTGHSMLYEVFEHLKVYITEQNKPSESCCVCMCDFEEVDEMDPNRSYTKTECFHYFHLACFAGYIQSELETIRHLESEGNVAGLKKEVFNLECPVCREVISRESKCLEDIRDINPDNFFQHQSEIQVYKPDAKMLEEQVTRAEMFEKQRLAGGIIDLDQEAAKFDVDTAWRPPTPPELKRQSETCQETTEDVVEAKDEIIDEKDLIFTPTSELGKDSENNDHFLDKSNLSPQKDSPIHQPRTNQSNSRKQNYYESHRIQRGTGSSPRHDARYVNSGRRDNDYSRKAQDHIRWDHEYSRNDYEFCTKKHQDYPRRDFNHSPRGSVNHSRRDPDSSNKDRDYWRKGQDYKRGDNDSNTKQITNDYYHSGREDEYSRKDRDSSSRDHDYSGRYRDYSSRDHDYLGRDHDYSSRDQGYSGRDYYYSGRDYDYSSRDHGYSGRDHGYSGRDYDYSGRDYDYPTRDCDYSSKDIDYSRNCHDYSGKDYDYSGRDRDYSKKDYYYTGSQYYHQDSRQGGQSRTRSKQRNPRGRGRSQVYRDQ